MKGLLKGKYSKHFTGITRFIKLYSPIADGNTISVRRQRSDLERFVTLPPHSYVHALMNTYQ